MAAIAVGIVAALAGGAFADNLPYPALSAGSTTSPTINEGGSFSETINYQVQQTGSHNTTFPASVSFSLSGAPAWVSLNHSSLSFSGYTDVESLTVSGTAPTGASGSSPYNFSIVPSTTAANLNVSPASVSMSVTVNAPVVTDTTAPSISFTQSPNGTNDWFTTAPATMTVTAADTDDGGVASLSCTLDGSPVTLTNTGSTSTTMYGDISTSTDGDHTVACTAKDSSNNTTTTDGPDLKLDTAAPSVSGAPTTSANGNGWYNSSVTIQWTCSDATSGVVASGTGSCPADSTISTEGSNQTVNSGTVLDNAGNSNSADSSPAVNIDEHGPTVDCSAATPDYSGGGGWYASNQSVSCTASDSLSGLANSGDSSFSLGPTTVAAGASGSQTLGPQDIYDRADNSTSTGSFTLQIDRQAPTGGSVTYADGYNTTGSVHVAATNATDSGSGIASNDLQSEYGTLSGGTCDFSGASWASVTLNGSGNDSVASGTCAKYRLVATDNVGNSDTFDSANVVKVDTTPPTIAFDHYDPAPNGNTAANGIGWDNGNVTMYWACSDSESGASSPVSQTVTTEGYDQKTTGTCTNGAGLTATDDEYVNIDKTAPTVAVTGVANGANYTLGNVPTAGCSTSDSLSGVQTQATLSTSGGPVGAVTATCSGGEDNAGNTASPVSATYNVIYNWTGFFQPVNNLTDTVPWNSAKAGSSIPVKFNLGGNQGTSIFMSGYPRATQIACPNSSTPTDLIDTATSTAGGSTLTYDTTAMQYIYVWQTSKTWATKCFLFQLGLNDGTTHNFEVQFTR